MARLDVIARLAETDGVLLVDKPAGIPAHDALKSVKCRFNLVKLGHGGTLEPTSSGLFVLLLGDANRLSQQLMGGDRAYECSLVLGRDTKTHDAAGDIVAEADFSSVTRERLDSALADFCGDVYQSPPEFSAVKRHENAAYETVCTAEGDELREKLVHVYRLVVVEFALPRVSFSISATKGFSVRAFARDLGKSLGCGAYVDSLRRVRCGKLEVKDAIGFHDLMRLDGADIVSRILPAVKAVAG